MLAAALNSKFGRYKQYKECVPYRAVLSAAFSSSSFLPWASGLEVWEEGGGWR